MSGKSAERPRMGAAGIITIVVVVAYVGLELYGLRHARELMEPEQIYREFTGARHAVAVCGAEPPERADFERNFRAVTARARADLEQSRPGATEAEIDEALATLRAGREAQVDALIEAEGCSGADVWRLLKLYEVRSRLNLRS